MYLRIYLSPFIYRYPPGAKMGHVLMFIDLRSQIEEDFVERIDFLINFRRLNSSNLNLVGLRIFVLGACSYQAQLCGLMN